MRLTDLAGLSFECPDEDAFPALRLARAVLADEGLAASIALNSANEALNDAVRAGQIPFGVLMPRLEQILDKLDMQPITSLDHIYDFDRRVRAYVKSQLEG